MCAATLGVHRPASTRGLLHTRCLWLMLPAWAGLVALSFLPANGVLESYFQAARAGGALFLLLQLVIILDVVYGTNEACLEADDTPSRAKLIGGALVFNAGTIVGACVCFSRRAPLPPAAPGARLTRLVTPARAGIVAMFVYLAQGVPRNVAFISVTLVLFVLFTALSLLPSVSGGVFTSGAVSAYCVFLCATAILSDPSRGGGGMPRWLQAIGFAIALGALLHSTFSATGQERTFDVAPAGGAADEGGEDEPEEVHPLSYSFFHFVFALGVRCARARER